MGAARDGATPDGQDRPVEQEQVDAVVAATLVLGGIIAESLATASEVTMAQLRVLTMASGEEPLTLGDVARELGVHASNATRTCDRLVRAGLLERRASPTDRRNVHLRLTEPGRSLVREVLDYRRRRVAELLEQLPAHTRAELATSLDALAAASAASGHRVPDGSRLSDD